MKLTDWAPLGMFMIAFIGAVYAVITATRNVIKKDIKAELSLDKIERLECEIEDYKAKITELERKLEEKNNAIMRLK